MRRFFPGRTQAPSQADIFVESSLQLPISIGHQTSPTDQLSFSSHKSPQHASHTRVQAITTRGLRMTLFNNQRGINISKLLYDELSDAP
jgi:hypothetical protein